MRVQVQSSDRKAGGSSDQGLEAGKGRIRQVCIDNPGRGGCAGVQVITRYSTPSPAYMYPISYVGLEAPCGSALVNW